MTRCWSLEPTDRPTFKMVCQHIDELLQANDDTPQQVRSRTPRSLVPKETADQIVAVSFSFYADSPTRTSRNVKKKIWNEESHRRQEMMKKSASRGVIYRRRHRPLCWFSCWNLTPSSPDLLRAPQRRRGSTGADKEHLPAVVTAFSQKIKPVFFHVKYSRFFTLTLRLNVFVFAQNCDI